MDSMIVEKSDSFSNTIGIKRRSDSKTFRNYSDSISSEIGNSEENLGEEASVPLQDPGSIPPLELQKENVEERAKIRKNKLILTDKDAFDLFETFEELKARGVKNNFEELVIFGLSRVSKNEWDEYLELHTPLEFKLHAALEMPEMRQKLKDMLNASKIQKA